MLHVHINYAPVSATWRRFAVHSFHMDHVKSSGDSLNEKYDDLDDENHLEICGSIPGKHTKASHLINKNSVIIHQR